MSKSKGNVIYADDLAKLFGVDAVRYFVLHEMPFDNDGQISWELVTERYNTELANVLGNLVSRTVAMINKYFGGTVTKPTGGEEEPDSEFKATVTSAVGKVIAKADGLRVADALTEIFNLFRQCRRFMHHGNNFFFRLLVDNESVFHAFKSLLYVYGCSFFAL